VSTSTIGPLLKSWRARRSRSQLDLAIDVGVSPRHLSFVETGRSKPSPELVLAIAAHLDVPLRERNTMLLAAGYAPRFTSAPLDDQSMTVITSAVRRLLAAHDPYPGIVLDRHWNVVEANIAAGQLLGTIPQRLCEPPVNLFRISLHPEGLAAFTTNIDEWGSYLLRELDRLIAVSFDPLLVELRHEIDEYPNVRHIRAVQRKASMQSRTQNLVITCDLNLGGMELSLFTTLTAFGTPQDVTIDELLIELFFPADEPTERALRAGSAN
jgi:transcriptional regulator with XRE-family HTH domain